MIQTSNKPSTSTSSPATTPGNPYVRLARPEDYLQIEQVARRAYIDDPVPMYLGAYESVSRKHSSLLLREALVNHLQRS